jgi:four helix bundle protein
MDLACDCYRLAKLMPRSEEFRIVSQLVRAAASVPANIAEGWMRGSRKDYARFVSIARGSLAEVETFLLLSIRTGLLSEGEAEGTMRLADRLGRQLNVLWNQLSKPSSPIQSPIPNP